MTRRARSQTCQAVQLEQAATETAEPDSLVLIVGDMNAEPGESTIEVFTGGGYVDSHVAAGAEECDPVTGSGCTSGRADEDLSDMTDPSSQQSHRIDYVFFNESRGCSAIDPTGVFREGGGPDNDAGLVHPADHSAVIATLDCPTTETQRAGAPDATLPTTTTTEPTSGTLAESDQVAIEAAFDLLFNGSNPDLDSRLQALEDREAMREVFTQQFEATAAISSQITVRIDSVTPSEPGLA